MGLIYNPVEAKGLLEAMTMNLKASEAIIEDLENASKHLVKALSNGTLTGTAYRAGKGLFSKLILPTITKSKDVTKGFQSEMKKFEKHVKTAGSDLLDEDLLKEELRLLKEQKASTQLQIDQYRLMKNKYVSKPDLFKMYENFELDWVREMPTIDNDIRKVEDKLKKLHDFDQSMSQLFSQELSDLTTVMKVVFALKMIAFDQKGNPAFQVKDEKESQKLREILNEFAEKATDKKDIASEALGTFFESIKDKVFKDGKNIGKSWAAKLQPRDARGRFVADSFAPRRWTTGKLKGVSSATSTAIAQGAKWGSRGLTALGAYDNFQEYNAEYHNTGRAFAYSAVATGMGVVGGNLGSIAGSAIAGAAVEAGLVTGGIATVTVVGAPIVAGFLIGTGAVFGVKLAYENIQPFKEYVDNIGDKINDIGKATSGGLNSLKGAFKW